MATFLGMKSPIGIAIIAVLALGSGILIGRYTAAPVVAKSAPTIASAPQLHGAAPISAPAKPVRRTVTEKGAEPDSSPVTSENVVTALRNALAHMGSRRTFVEFGKLAELIDAKNVGEVLAFAEGLPKAQDKTMVLSLLLNRWAEFDPKSALAYAENLPAGNARTRAITSALGGWAEHDPAAATAWTLQLPAGQLRDRAMQSVVFSLVDKDPQAALSLLQNSPPRPDQYGIYASLFSRWAST